MPSSTTLRARGLRALVVPAVALLASACMAPLASLTHDGLSRTYLLYAPPDVGEGAPLLVVLHGGGGNPRQVARYFALDAIADEHGLVVVYPGARDENWNDGRGASGIEEQQDDVDDVGFIVALVDEIARTKGIDRARVTATGISNGAMMSFRLACERPDVFAAIAPVAGALPAPLSSTCAPSAPVAVLAMNGTDDTFVPMAGGDIMGRAARGSVVSLDESLVPFVRASGCTGTSTTTHDDDADDRTTRETHVWQGCVEGFEIVSHRFVGGGHTLPGIDGRPHEAFIGVTSQELDGPRAIGALAARARR